MTTSIRCVTRECGRGPIYVVHWHSSPDSGLHEYAKGDGDDNEPHLLLISAVDGRVYALDGRDGSLVWSADTGGQVVMANYI